ncbi:CpaD family pilus assembly lipoprotein [Castellaniella sp.]|uniref:CpaD family pilus assembly lipoprotein n=1 Tax=Castellaniella sp. TaxID=1955812 RepID=UPI0025B87877|nr:CpaD family pilus assembly lipoprotein [Castellaniella sp.]
MKTFSTLFCVISATLSLTGCFPHRDMSQFPDTSAINVTRGSDGKYIAVPPDCSTLMQPSEYSTVTDPRPGIAFGCATLTNLAAQVANPQDLVTPTHPYIGQHADTAGSAVTRYRLDKIIPLNKTTSTSKTGGN